MSFATEVLELETFPLKNEGEDGVTAFDALLLSPTPISTEERLPYVKNLLLEHFRQDVPRLHERLAPLMKQLLEDAEDEVRIAAVSLLPSMAEVLCRRGPMERKMIVEFVQCSATLLSDASNYVREAALATFDDLVSFLTPFEQEQEIVPVITDLLGSDDRMDRVCGLLLLVSLIEKGTSLGGETHLVNWLTQLLSDDDKEVRQELASLYPAFLKALTKGTVMKTALPHFRFLVKDKESEVRKAAAEVLHDLLEVIPDGEHLLDLQAMVMSYHTRLSTDSSPIVRLTAQKSLGDVLEQLDVSLITDDMIDAFVGCARELPEQPATLMLSSCAQMFTAVAVKIGASRWNRLKDLFTALTQSMDEDILHSLAMHLHELAQLLPCDVFRRDVLPFLTKMMHGGSMSVRSSLAENFAPLILSLNTELQELCLYHLDHLMKSDLASIHYQSTERHSYVTFFTKGWRLRASLAQQLSQMTSLLRAELVDEYVLPIAFHLCEDSVAHVRSEATNQLIQILTVPDPEHTPLILTQLSKWQNSGNFKIRCVAARICQTSLLKHLSADVAQQMELIVTKLKADPVVDVRRLFE